MGRDGAPIRFAYGAYGIRARATLDWTRVDQCEGLITRLLCSSEPVSASDRREVDFQLAPVNGFRDFVQVNFGRLLPIAQESNRGVARRLTRVILSINLLDFRPL